MLQLPYSLELSDSRVNWENCLKWLVMKPTCQKISTVMLQQTDLTRLGRPKST